MAVDLTQFVEGDDILVTVRASVYRESDGDLRARLTAVGKTIPLDIAVKAEHITPEIKDGKYYMAGRQLYVGSTGGVLYGPLGGLRAPDRHEPTQVALIRGLRPAEVRPVVPA